VALRDPEAIRTLGTALLDAQTVCVRTALAGLTCENGTHTDCLSRGSSGLVLLARVHRENSEHPMDEPGAVFAVKVFPKRDVFRLDRVNFLLSSDF
jgi:hypothetical protein